MDRYDAIILGGGPAGLSAGLYGSRAGLKSIVIEAGIPGGQVLLTDRVENYPGFPEGTTGQNLIECFLKQTRKWGCEVRSGCGKSKLNNITPPFVVETEKGTFSGSTVIIATGCEPRRLGVKGENELINAGVSYCAICDGSFFEGLDVVVIGGGDSALEEALYLAKICRCVNVIHRRDQFRGAECLQRLVKENQKIKTIVSSVVDAFEGNGMLESVRIRCLKTNTCSSLPASGAFIYVGQLPRSDHLPPEITLDLNGFIVAGDNMETSVPGIFAAGDVRTKRVRQIATAVNDGVVAVLAAEKHLLMSQCII